MFHGNQIFDVTCEPGDLELILDFAVRLFNENADMFTRPDGRVSMAFSEPVPGVYALGTGSMRPYTTGPNKGWSVQAEKGWTDYPFDYDPKIIAKIAGQWLMANPPDPVKRPGTDGSAHPGFRVRSLHSMEDELPCPHKLDGWAWIDAILLLTPCWLRYDK